MKQVLPKLDYTKYQGEWVIICQNRIVAHNKDLTKIRDDIAKCRNAPTITKVPKESTLIF